MGLELVTKPATLPVMLAAAKKQVEVGESDTSHDDHLIRLIRTATREVERYTRKAILTQTWRLSLYEWPMDRRIYLPRPPLQSVTSITYVDDNGVTQTLSPSLYQVSTDATPGCVEPAYDEEWPPIRPLVLDAINITYVAGFGDSPADVPAEFANVIYELVAFRFMNRGDVNSEIPKHIKWSLDSLRCGARLGFYEIDS